MNSDDTNNNSTPSYKEVEAAYAKAVEEQDAFGSLTDTIPTRPEYSSVNTASANSDEPIPNSELSIIFEALHFASKFINEWLRERINLPETTIPAIDEELDKRLGDFIGYSGRTANLSPSNLAFFRKTVALHVADYLRNYVATAKQQQRMAEILKQQQGGRIISPEDMNGEPGSNMFRNIMNKFKS